MMQSSIKSKGMWNNKMTRVEINKTVIVSEFVCFASNANKIQIWYNFLKAKKTLLRISGHPKESKFGAGKCTRTGEDFWSCESSMRQDPPPLPPPPQDEALSSHAEAMERPLNINPGNFASRQIERGLNIDTGSAHDQCYLRIIYLTQPFRLCQRQNQPV